MLKTTNGNSNKNIRKKVIIIFIIIGFMAIEFPGIFIVREQIYPFIFGFPFLYGYAVCIWIYFLAVFFYAYKTAWGKEAFFKNKHSKKGNKKVN